MSTCPRSVILDADFGTDDAIAFLMLLYGEMQGLIKIEAITCVDGNGKLPDVCRNCIRLLEYGNRTDVNK